uniref:Uncharacterized protein n=1 Tax=Anguilla anguilla TaxID=7936 RepID=A0A0E9RHD9_ANGAN
MLYAESSLTRSEEIREHTERKLLQYEWLESHQSFSYYFSMRMTDLIYQSGMLRCRAE